MSPVQAVAGDDKDLQAFLDANAGGVCQLGSKTYTIYNPVIMPSDTELRGNGETVIEIAQDRVWNKGVSAIGGSNLKNVTIDNIIFKGNAENQAYVPYQPGTTKQYGQQYQTFIYFTYSKNIKVYRCDFSDNLGDFLRLSKCVGVEFFENTGHNGGHDGLFALRSKFVSVHNNNISTKVNSAFRFLDVEKGQIFNNTVIAPSYSTGLYSGSSIQIQHDKEPMRNIEIAGNQIYDSCLAGIWVVGKTSGGEDVRIHHNAIYRAFWGPYSWAGGIVCSGYDNVAIDHNVLDGCYLSSISFIARVSSWATAADCKLDSNIFYSSVPSRLNSIGGYGVYNDILAQSVESSNNCYYGNSKGNTYQCSVSDTDLFTDPKVSSTPSGWTWNGLKRVCSGYSVNNMGYIPSNDYDYGKPISNEELEEFESIFDILNMQFSDSGRTEQTADSIPYSVQETEQGKIAGGIKIIGFKNLISIDNISYIPDNESILYKAVAVRAPSFNPWNIGVSNISKEVTAKIENGTAYAALTVKMEYYTISSNQKTGEMKKKRHVSTVIFKDSCPAPEILHRPTEKKGVIIEYPSYTLAYVPSEGLTKLVFEYKWNKSEHVFFVGERAQNEKGILYTNFTRLNYWKGNISHYGESAYLTSPFDPEKLTVTAYTPYESFNVTSFQYIKKEIPESVTAPWFYPSIGVLLILGYGAWYYLKKLDLF